MNPIKINQSACGSGKTTDLIKTVKQEISEGESVLIFSVSIKACADLKAHFPSAILVNSSNSRIPIKTQFKTAIKKSNLIIATHHMFHLLDSELIESADWIVHLDEEPKMFSTKYTKVDKGAKVLVMREDSNEIEMCDVSSIDIVSVKPLAPFKLNWKSITIYCAALMSTGIGRMFVKHNVPHTIISDFTKTDGSRITFKCPILPENCNKLSARLKQDDPRYITSMRREVPKDEPYIVARNSKDVSDGSALEIQVPHNISGSNSERHINNVLIESTLNLSYVASAKAKEVFDCDEEGLMLMMGGHTYMQIINRCSIRDPSAKAKITVVCCPMIAKILCEHFFDGAKIEHFDKIKRRKSNKVAMTQTERNTKCKAKRLTKGDLK